MRRSPLLRFLSACGLLLPSANLVTAADFQPLGFNFHQDYVSVSENGSVVVGALLNESLYQWTRETGTEVVLEGAFHSVSISGDGSMIVAEREGDSGEEAIRITAEKIDLLPPPLGFDDVRAPEISHDGSTVFGFAEEPETQARALVRWTGDGIPEILEEWLRGERSYIAQRVSATGEIALLSFSRLWTEESGIEELPFLPSSSNGTANGLSGDGRLAVGVVMIEGVRHPIRWEGLSPPELLAFDPVFLKGCEARDITSGGSHIVGNCYKSSTSEQVAAVWTPESRMVSLQDLLVNDHGLRGPLEGWVLERAYFITDDGRFVVGRGINPNGQPEGFWVDLSPNLPGDFNADGQLDALDIDELSAVVREGNHPKRFDLTDDDLVTDDDRVEWVHQLKNTYFGDANLDGEFNTADLTHVLELGKYETGQAAGWDEGDWNGDAIFGTGDFVTALIDGGYELGPKPDVASVPEPTSVLLFVIGLFGIVAYSCRDQN